MQAERRGLIFFKYQNQRIDLSNTKNNSSNWYDAVFF